MPRTATRSGNGTFGSGAVFWTTLSTILGAVLFLRLGYVVGHAGLLGTLAIIVIGHAVTIPTAMAIAEIATNQRVEGGGVYYMLSRSFGLTIGGAIGIALFVSQAVSVSFYIIAFAEAFRPALPWASALVGRELSDLRLVSVPALLLLAGLVLTRGAGLGLKALYVVVAALLLSLAFFFLGPNVRELSGEMLSLRVADPDPFFKVFAICFPAFTGLTAGVGLSGNLRDPKRAIPLGTLLAVGVGLAVYVLVALKLAIAASPEELAAPSLVMARIAIWGPIIPIGLASATLSSALGSILIAPRTLQALAADGSLPSDGASRWLAKTRPHDNEPIRASLLTCAVAMVFVLIGDVDFVAQVIAMFFMVTYGAICLISLLEHFAADPSYRPAFRSRWQLSLLGAALSFWLMFEMNAPYAALALTLLALAYWGLRSRAGNLLGPADLLQGAIFQVSRRLQLSLQRAQRDGEQVGWRPSVVCLSDASFTRHGVFDLLRWISHRQGFATYIHFIKGYLSKATCEEAADVRQRLIRLVDVSEGNIYVDTMVSPSYTSAFSQLIQLPGISGKRNNLVAFDFDRRDLDRLDYVLDHFPLAFAAGFDVCILGVSERSFGYKREIHLWLKPGDYENANLMILLAYIIVGHPEWRRAVIKMYEVAANEEARATRTDELRALVRSGRLPISERNIEVIVDERDPKLVIGERSQETDLSIVGFRKETLRHQGAAVFEGYPGAGNMLFVSTLREIEMERDSRPTRRVEPADDVDHHPDPPPETDEPADEPELEPDA